MINLDFNKQNLKSFQTLSWDNNRWILVVVTEYLTKWMEVEALPDATAETIGQVFCGKGVLARHGAPKRILTDRGANFLSEMFQKVNGLLGIQQSSTTAYHPQTNALTERFNRTLVDMLSIYVGENQDDWDEFLP